MAKNLLDLAKSLAAKRKALDEAASDLAKQTALTIVSDLAYKTPVDTSKAISSWEVTLDAPSTNKPGPHFPGKAGSTYRASAAETIALAKSMLAKKKPGQPIFITNNQPYIRRLNDGSSAQQPAGFVERAILLGRKMKAKFKIRIK
jgi:hypothetical protein